MSGEVLWIKTKLRRIADSYFWVVFIPIIIVKLAVFYFAAWHYLILGSHPLFGMDFQVVEGYSDFTYYYMNFVRQFVQGHLPYTDALYTIYGRQVYIYPPLFVYILSAFYFVPSEVVFPNLIVESLLLGRSLEFLRVGFAFIFFDLATCAVIYATARRLTANRFIPVVAMLVFALNPISIWWGNYLWLSTPIHTFFLTLGFYFLVRGNMLWAAIWITVATMTKQTAALLLPLVVFMEFRRSLERLYTSIAIIGVIILLLSLPYIALYPLSYFQALIGGIGAYWFSGELPPVTHPVPVSILAIGWPEPFKFIAISAVYYGIPWAVFLAVFWVTGGFIAEKSGKEYTNQLLLIALLLSLASHIFLARGLYKYYLIALLPFLALFGTSLNRPIIPHKTANQIATPQRRLRYHLWGAINNWSTVWFIFAIIVSTGVFFIDRYFTHLLLFSVFLPLLGFSIYRYIWSPFKQRKHRHRSAEPSEGTGLGN
ncbi:MAG: hypothetical protein ACFE89_10200 [Candidatus Hodarchaeota archaeon]